MDTNVQTAYRQYGIEFVIAKWYIYLLVFKMISGFSMLQSIAGSMASYFDFILLGVGIIFMLFSGRGTIELGRPYKILRYFIFLIMMADLISLFWAIFYSNSFGELDGEDTFSAVFPILLYYAQYALMLLYHNYIFGMFKKSEIWKILLRVTRVLLVIGYIQIAICLFGGIFATIYDKLNFLGLFRPSSYLLQIDRISLCGSEPASAGELIGLIVFPVLLARMLINGIRPRYFIELILWLPIVFYTKSSTCYLLVALTLIVFVYFYIKDTSKQNRWGLVPVVILTAVVGIFAFMSNSGYGIVGDDNEVMYLLFKKVSDQGNESSVTRTIPTYINFRIFMDYPLGIGNGNQGFFYQKYFPDWGGISLQTYKNIQGVADGGVFVPSIFSGYGIIGVLGFAIFFIRLYKYAHENKQELGIFYYVFVMVLVVFLANGFQTDYFGKIFAWFMLSIPFMTQCLEEEEEWL